LARKLQVNIKQPLIFTPIGAIQVHADKFLTLAAPANIGMLHELAVADTPNNDDRGTPTP
jgi:hypothetical protein